MKTPGQSVKFVQSRQQKHQNQVNDAILEFLLLILNKFDNLFWCSIVHSEQGNTDFMLPLLPTLYQALFGIRKTGINLQEFWVRLQLQFIS